MKKTIFLVLFLSLWSMVYGLWSVAAQEAETPKEEQQQQLVVYADNNDPANSFHPSEFIGDKVALEFNDAWEPNAQSGKTCIQVTYKATGNFGWAGLYWVNPSGNWGDKQGGYDLRFAKKLSFWVRGEKGGEHIAVFKFGGLKGVFPDSDNHGIGPIILTKEWQQLSVDVSQRNMKYISAGFSFALTKAHNSKGCIFYIDNITYE